MNTGVSWSADIVDTTWAWHRVLAMQTKLHRWATADPSRRFDDVFNLVHDPAFLVAAWDRVRGNKGGRTAGVDGIVPKYVRAEDVTEMLTELRHQVKTGKFTPLPVRQRTIPKAGGKTRSLGIPTMTDRIIQASLKLVLEPIFEADFQPCSYGFRPRRRAQDAVAEIHFYTTGNRSYEWVFEGDIKACFDEIDHSALMGRLRGRIADKRVLGVIRAFLKAGVLTEDGLNRDTRTGTPQGGILSPLLANIAFRVRVGRRNRRLATPQRALDRRLPGIGAHREFLGGDPFPGRAHQDRQRPCPSPAGRSGLASPTPVPARARAAEAVGDGVPGSPGTGPGSQPASECSLGWFR